MFHRPNALDMGWKRFGRAYIYTVHVNYVCQVHQHVSLQNDTICRRVGQWREETEGHSGDSNLSRLKERFPGQGKPCVQVKIFQLFIIQVPGSGSSQGLKNQGVISYRKQYGKKTLSKLPVKENIIPWYHRKLSVFFDEWSYLDQFLSMEWSLPTIVSLTSSSSSRASRSRLFSASSRSSLAIRSLDLLRARSNSSLVRLSLDLLRDSSSSRRASRSLDRLRRRACSTLMSRSSFSVGVRGRNPYLSLKEGRYNRGLGERDRRLRRRSSKEPVSAATSASVVIKEHTGTISVIFYD